MIFHFCYLATARMNQYLSIQYKRFCRISFEKRIHPALSFGLLSAVFIGFSELVFSRAPFPEYTYAIVGVILLVLIANSKRIEFLQHCFKTKNYQKIRLLENTVIIGFFVGFLLYKQAYVVAPVLFLVAILLAFVELKTNVSFTIPTPFGRFPFEFTRGFRRLFPAYFVAYSLSYWAINAHNFNFGLVILLATFLVSATFFSYNEPVYYLWIYSRGPKRFIGKKLRTILLYSFLPGTPIIVTLLLFFPDDYWMIIAGICSGILYIITFMLAKYANYPCELSITDGFITAACIFVPPLMIIVLPLFYYRSLNNLSNLLYD